MGYYAGHRKRQAAGGPEGGHRAGRGGLDMMNGWMRMTAAAAAAAFLSGCASYSLRPAVPEEMRTIAVAVFENETDFPELGAAVTKYTLREFQREGTFTIARQDGAALKLIGRLAAAETRGIHYDRNYGSRASEYRYDVTAKITLWDASTGKVLIDDRPVRAGTTFLTQGDMLTGLRDASPRIAQELARGIVDAVLGQW